MFGWFKRSRAAPIVEQTMKVWISMSVRDASVCSEARQALAAGRRVLVVHHFADTLDALEPALHERGIPWAHAEYGGDVTQLIGEDPARAIVVLSTKLRPAAHPPAQRDATRPWTILVVGMYPLLRADEHVDRFSEGLPFQVQVVRHVALDEPPMRVFAGEKIVSLMEKLGMEESEPIDHPWVTDSVRNAQKTLEKRATGDRPARSADEWALLNLPRRDE
jgi:hypothetical protein